MALLVKNVFLLYARLVAVNINKCVGAALYNKVLKMSKKSLAVTSTGKLVTLVSGELQTIEKTFWYVPQFYTIVIMLFAIFAYIAVFFYEASAIAFGVLFLMISIILGTSGIYMKWVYLTGTYSDQRINHISDIINGIKTIKAYCWEYVFDKKVKEARNAQLNNIKNMHCYLCIGAIGIFAGGYIVVLIVLFYHWGIGRELEYSPSIVLLSLGTLMSIASIPSFINGIGITLKLNSIFDRVNEVMKTNEKQDNYTHAKEDFTKILHSDINSKADIAILFENVTASWGFKIKHDIYSGKTEVITDEPTDNLELISFEAYTKDFIAVIGSVGSGKTTLLNAIMNELEVSDGRINVKGSISYVEQEPFIISDTVKNNILFGKELNEDKLNQAIELC